MSQSKSSKQKQQPESQQVHGEQPALEKKEGRPDKNAAPSEPTAQEFIRSTHQGAGSTGEDF